MYFDLNSFLFAVLIIAVFLFLRKHIRIWKNRDSIRAEYQETVRRANTLFTVDGLRYESIIVASGSQVIILKPGGKELVQKIIDVSDLPYDDTVVLYLRRVSLGDYDFFVLPTRTFWKGLLYVTETDETNVVKK